MDTKKSGITKRFLIMLLIAVMMMAFTGIAAMAEQQVSIQEGA